MPVFDAVDGGEDRIDTIRGLHRVACDIELHERRMAVRGDLAPSTQR